MTLFVMQLVLARNQTHVCVVQTGRDNNAQFRNALVYWQTTPMFAQDTVHARNQTLVSVVMDGMVLFVKLQCVLAYLLTAQACVTPLVLAYNLTHVYVMQIGKDRSALFHSALVSWQTILPKFVAVEVLVHNQTLACANRVI